MSTVNNCGHLLIQYPCHKILLDNIKGLIIVHLSQILGRLRTVPKLGTYW